MPVQEAAGANNHKMKTIVGTVTALALIFLYGFLYNQEMDVSYIFLIIAGIWVILNVLIGYYSKTKGFWVKYKQTINKGVIAAVLFMAFHLFVEGTGSVGIMLVAGIAVIVAVVRGIGSFNKT